MAVLKINMPWVDEFAVLSVCVLLPGAMEAFRRSLLLDWFSFSHLILVVKGANTECSPPHSPRSTEFTHKLMFPSSLENCLFFFGTSMSKKNFKRLF